MKMSYCLIDTVKVITVIFIKTLINNRDEKERKRDRQITSYGFTYIFAILLFLLEINFGRKKANQIQKWEQKKCEAYCLGFVWIYMDLIAIFSCDFEGFWSAWKRMKATHTNTHPHITFMCTRDTPIEFIIVFWSFVTPTGGFIAIINVNVECSLIFVWFCFHFSLSLSCSHFLPRYLFQHILFIGRLYQTLNNSGSPNIIFASTM